MKAVVYDAPKTFAIREIPTPQPGPGEVLITVNQVGVCGTDLHIHAGEFQAKFPLIPGHELVGDIAALGEGVDKFAVGEQVTVNPNIYCGQCEYCLAGRLILCPNLKGMGSNFPGFFAEYVTVPANLVFSVEGLDPDVAVFAEPAACAMHGLERLNIRARLQRARLRRRPHRPAAGAAHRDGRRVVGHRRGTSPVQAGHGAAAWASTRPS